MLRLDFLYDSYRCYSNHVGRLTEKISDIDSEKSATVKQQPSEIQEGGDVNVLRRPVLDKTYVNFEEVLKSSF